jgi:hypothetical protein
MPLFGRTVFLYKFKWLLQFIKRSGLDVNKNLEKFRNLFSQNFEILQPYVLKMMVVHPQIEEKIVYMVGYSWTWDLNGTGKTAQQYRQMLIKLFEPHGFKEYQINEPNVCLKPENLFMCRVGKNIRQVIIERFKWLRFGLSPWTWKCRMSNFF